ncbi:hypothetical protein E3N88_41114 [Mikania micrantha]|uniref:Uncharacterized protein n=1 Tax=Mikania micrantha TaxID=192012 RepID=A0A5N6LPM2_9ASTR|nr:hypothetical protein E3N88_41114 [Mikania micrantha]
MFQPVLGALNCQDQFCGTVDPQARMEDTEVWETIRTREAIRINLANNTDDVRATVQGEANYQIVKDKNFLLINEGYWVVMGDFDAVRVPEERLNSQFDKSCASEFNNFIFETGLQ